MSFRKWITEVKDVSRFLDESFTVSLSKKGIRGPGRVPWARIGLEKFCDRVIPQIIGDDGAKSLATLIDSAVKNAVSYGSATLLAFENGDVAVANPRKSYVQRDEYGHTVFKSFCVTGSPLTVAEESPEMIGIDGFLYFINFTEDGEKELEVIGQYFPIFYKEGRYGSSRITPAIRRDILAQARTELRAEVAEDFQTWPQRILNGVWDGFTEEVGEDVAAVAAGVREILAIPTDPDTGGKVSVDSWEGTGFGNYVAIKESRMKTVAAAFNIDASELGFTQSQFSSAEAVYASKEDLVLEIQSFTAAIKDTVESFIEYVAVLKGFEFEAFSWANPATPSIGSRMDAFVKLAAVLPQVKYSKKAISDFGLLSAEAIDEIFASIDNEQAIADTIDRALAEAPEDSSGGEL